MIRHSQVMKKERQSLHSTRKGLCLHRTFGTQHFKRLTNPRSVAIDNLTKEVSVAPDTDPFALADVITSSARKGFANDIVLRAVGPRAVHKTFKAAALGSRDLRRSSGWKPQVGVVGLSFEQEAPHPGAVVRMMPLLLQQEQGQTLDTSVVPAAVGKAADPVHVGGYLMNCLRESKRASMRYVGDRAVGKLLTSAIVAQTQLREEQGPLAALALVPRIGNSLSAHSLEHFELVVEVLPVPMELHKKLTSDGSER